MNTDYTQSELTLDAVQQNLEAMLNFIDDQTVKVDFNEQERYDIQVGCEEVLVNIIHYAYQGQTGQIHILCDASVSGYRLVISIIDSGKAFDPLSVPEPDITAPFEERSVGGLGIYLLRKMFDHLEYSFADSRNCIKLYKR
jgi:serine/threonine-protein kinase RsbW